jgi:hypothetical protein
MFRGRRHIAATIDPDASSDEEEAIDIVPMAVPDTECEDVSKQWAGHGCIGPDPIMAWKAQACTWQSWKCSTLILSDVPFLPILMRNI